MNKDTIDIIMTTYDSLMSQPPDARTEPDWRSVDIPAVPKVIRSPLMRIINKPVGKNLGTHFYQLPIVRLEGCRMLLTLDTPCSVCGLACAVSVHNMRIM